MFILDDDREPFSTRAANQEMHDQQHKSGPSSGDDAEANMSAAGSHDNKNDDNNSNKNKKNNKNNNKRTDAPQHSMDPKCAAATFAGMPDPETPQHHYTSSRSDWT